MSGEEIETIKSLTAKFAEAFEARDFAALGNMYADDAVICPPVSNIVTGKGGIQSFWQQNDNIQGFNFRSIVVKQLSENVMRVVGTVAMRVKPPQQDVDEFGAGNAPFGEIASKYIFIWQKQGGEWKIDSSIWNRIGTRRSPFAGPSGPRRAFQNTPGGGMGPGGGGPPRGGGPRGR